MVETTSSCQPHHHHHQVVGKCERSGKREFTLENILGRKNLYFCGKSGRPWSPLEGLCFRGCAPLHFNAFIAIHWLHFAHVNSFMSSRSCQVIRFNSLISSHAFHFINFKSFMSSHSFQLIHVSSFISCISCHVNSLLYSLPWIPISHVSSWKLPPRRVPGTTWFSAHHCAMSPLYLHMLASKVSCRMLGGKNSLMMCMRRLCHCSHTAEAFTKTWRLGVWYCSVGSLTKLYTHCVRLHTMSRHSI